MTTDRVRALRLEDVMAQCLRHFAHLDESNAAIHCSPVQYSPITFALAWKLDGYAHTETQLVSRVLEDDDSYPLDMGR